MYQIRHYNQMHHPDLFKVGVRGWWIRTLNWLRWKLEVYVQGQVVRYLLKNGVELEPRKAKTFLEMFMLDVEEEKLAYKRTSPRYLEHVDPVPAETIVPRGDRYAYGRQRSALDAAKAAAEGTSLPDRPIPIDELARRYGAEVKSRRYARGRRFTLLDPDGDFVPIPKEAAREVVPDLSNHRDDDGDSGRAGSDEPVGGHSHEVRAPHRDARHLVLVPREGGAGERRGAEEDQRPPGSRVERGV